jgi:hypothetical protein
MIEATAAETSRTRNHAVDATHDPQRPERATLRCDGSRSVDRIRALGEAEKSSVAALSRN